MVIQPVGVVLIVVPASFLGFQLAARYRQRLQALEEVVTALKMMETGIEYTRTPLPALFQRLAAEGEGEGADFFAALCRLLAGRPGITPQEAWTRALERKDVLTPLNNKDREALSSFGKALGNSDPDNQIKHLSLTQERLQQRIDHARQEADKNIRLYRYMGFLGGLLLVLLLL